MKVMMLVVLQVRGDCHGGPGPAADGLPLPEHQALRGELPTHGGQAAGVQGTGPAGPGNQLSETPPVTRLCSCGTSPWSSVDPQTSHNSFCSRAASSEASHPTSSSFCFNLMKDET